MANDAEILGNTLRIVRDFACTRERLWSAWVTPTALIEWFGPEHDPASEFSADLRVGGAWRACLRSRASGRRLWVSGHYKEIIPQERIVFSFRWEGTNHEDGPGVETLVTLTFLAQTAELTRLVLCHEGLVSKDSADGHTDGWQSCLLRLESYLSHHRSLR
jgi:uncharacterized protein YndB with AHSA1/START domain